MADLMEEASRALEAMIMVADQPADPAVLAQLVEMSPGAVEAVLESLAYSYEAENRGFRLLKVAGGWRYQSHEDCNAYVERYVLSGQVARLSAAALETLAIVAYKQPISRAQVAAIRGVNVDGVIRTLQQRGYIDEVVAGPGARPGLAVRDHPAPPGTAGPELAGRTAVARRLHPGRGRGRAVGDGPAGRSRG